MGTKKRVRKRRLYKATVLVVSFILLFTATGFTGVGDSYAAPLNNKIYRGDIVIPFDEVPTNYELSFYRGEFEKHFLNTDGTITAYSYANPIHYLDSDGNWQDIDNTLIKSTEGFTNTDSPNKIQLSYTARNEGLASVKLEGYEVSWGIQGINNVQGYEVEKQEAIDRRDLTHLTSKVKYDNVFENTSLVYTLSSCSLSEDLIFGSLPNFDSVTYQIQTTNLIATLEGSEVVFTSTTEEGKEIFRFQAPYLCDSAFKLTYDITVILNATEGGYTLTYILDRTWLQSEERVYPITLDPTITSWQHYSNIEDTHINDWNPNTNYMNAPYLNIGNVGGRNDIWIKITTLPTLPLRVAIVDAKLEMTHSLGTTTWGDLEIRELTSEWHSSTLTWNNQWNCSGNYLHGGIYPFLSGSYYRYYIDVTGTVDSWYWKLWTTGSMSNNWGFALNYENIYHNDYNTLYSSDHGSIGSSYLPAISVTYDIVPPTPTFVGNLLWPVSNVYYYISPITKAYYNVEILAAIADWENAVNTSCGYTKLHLTEVYTPGPGYATVAIYIDNSPGDNAYVHWYACNNEVDPYVSDWTYCEMWLNMYNLVGFTSEEVQGVIAHEFGHVWGLAHNEEYDDTLKNELCTYSIMCTYEFGRQVHTVNGADLDAFNSKY